jgi:hypothetical protein
MARRSAANHVMSFAELSALCRGSPAESCTNVPDLRWALGTVRGRQEGRCPHAIHLNAYLEAWKATFAHCRMRLIPAFGSSAWDVHRTSALAYGIVSVKA